MSVEAAVEGHDPLDPMAAHHGDVDGIACGQRFVAEKDVLGGLRVLVIDWEDLIDNPEDGVEGGLDGVATAYGRIAVADLLQDLRVGQ
jgi:hypothetical protein